MRKLTSPAKPLSLKEHLPALETIFADSGVVALYLYGSHGTPQQTPLSDIDLAVVAPLGQRVDEPELLSKVTDLLGDDVSLTILNRAPLPFRFLVLETGRPLFVFDKDALADFTEQTLVYYHDFRPDYEAMVRDYDSALRERYGGP